MATDLDEAARKGQQREVRQNIRAVSGKKKKQSITVRNKLGQLIADPHAQKERWKEHFFELLNPPPQKVDISDLENITPNPILNTSLTPMRLLQEAKWLLLSKNSKTLRVQELMV